MTIDQHLARLRAHRNNIQRYRRLLRTKLTKLERQFIEGRISDQMQAAKRLSSDAIPFTLQIISKHSAIFHNHRSISPHSAN